MEVMCKQSITYHSDIMHKTFTVIKNCMYNYQDYKEFIQVRDDYGITYRFRPLDFKNYFYTKKELRKEKLQKLQNAQ